jgi:hypothetical protein
MSSSAEREKRLSNLGKTIGNDLDQEIRREKASLRYGLSQDFVREVMMAEACTSQRDFPGALYHIVIADMIHRTLNDLEQ